MAQRDGDGHEQRDGDAVGEAAGARYGWRSATLRPTGVVVFATLERPAPRPARFSAAGRDGTLGPPFAPEASLLDAEEGASPGPVTMGGAGRHRWRRGVGRGAAWLLGR